ncbi:glycosyltransferase family 2 protein [Flavobacterium piscisymbiosum]|uniref:Glycosyltransferase n=1 Tax=Flavobacterium piscisymbiosum TaxID=2893753 RepID=A0ABS8M8B8_9FLAO|nr:glycosyltransferase family 2 protein [Flavobacterium sp. F-30]MCC9061720.1 glycosyltransferase [Flavobacterium sp. F-30]
MINSLVSIIIPTYNRAHIINETLDSIAAQTYQSWECIMVDDGSTDDTDKIVNKYLEKDIRFQFYSRPENRLKGANACRNFGIENSKGEYIMFLDSDDICETFCLQERVEKVVNDSSADLLIKDTSLFILNEKYTFSINKDPEINTSENYLRMFLRYEIPWPIMGCFYKKSALENCKFDENLNRFQDVSFNIKLLSQAKQLKIVRDFKIDTYYRVDDNKVFNEGFVSNMLNALLVFYQIHVNLIQDKNYAADLRKFSCKIILEFVIPYFSQNKKVSNRIFFWSVNSKLYTINQKRVLLLMMIFLNTRLFEVKKIAMNKFRNRFKRILSQ